MIQTEFMVGGVNIYTHDFIQIKGLMVSIQLVDHKTLVCIKYGIRLTMETWKIYILFNQSQFNEIFNVYQICSARGTMDWNAETKKNPL